MEDKWSFRISLLGKVILRRGIYVKSDYYQAGHGWEWRDATTNDLVDFFQRFNLTATARS